MIVEALIGGLIGDYLLQNDYMAANKKKSTVVCAVHCAVWTACVLVCAWTWNFWLAAWLFGTHFAIDRTGIVGWYMEVMGQRRFRDSLGPWSVIAVDNTLHMLTILVGFKFFGLQ